MANSRERPHVFAGPHIDRYSPPRRDAAAVAAALAKPDTRLVPVWRSKNLLRRAATPSAALLPTGEWPALTADPDALVLLGTWRQAALFACELPAEAEPALGAEFEFADLRLMGALLPADQAGLLAYARALIWWRARHRHCGVCGAPMTACDAGHVMSCTRAGCDNESFPRIDPAIIVLVTEGERALLGRQASWPPDRYSTIAGFVEPGESLEDCVVREVHEETGVVVGDVRYHSSQPWPFPSSLMLGFDATALSTDITCNDAELEDARWFSRADIAQGMPALPPPQSISYRLIEDWYDAGATVPLASEPGARRWDRPR